MTPHSGTQIHPTHGTADTSAIQSEQLFRAIFEQAAVGVALIETATGRFVRVNQRYCEIAALSRENMTAMTFMAITHPDDLQTDLNNMEKLKAGRIREFSMEKRYFRSDGSIVWVDLSVSPLWEVGGSPSFHIAVVQDITGRKQAEQGLSTVNMTLEQLVRDRTQELEESRQQLQAILDGTSDAVFLKDIEGRYLLVNRAVEQFVGKRQDEIIGHDDRFIFSLDDAQVVMEADRKVMSGGETMTYEDIVTTADGKQRTFLSTKGPVFDNQGCVTGLFGISRDITERKRMEDELRRSEAFTTSIVDNLPLMVFIKDAEDLRFLRMNKAGEQLLGYSQRELLGKNDQDYFPKPVADFFTTTDREVLASGRLLNIADEPIVIRDGTQRFLHTKKIPLVDHEGRPQYLLGISEDITERKQAEKALRESEERFRSIFEHAGTGITILDLGGQFLQANPSYCRLVGYTEAELRTLNCKQVVHPEDLPVVLAQRERLYTQEVPSFELEGRHRHKDGHDVWVHKFVSVLRDEAGQPRYLFALVTDVTERRQVHALLEQRVAERTKAVLASEVFTRAVLNSLSAKVAVLDATGVIMMVNRVWEMAESELDPDGRHRLGVGANYLQVCRRAAGKSVKAKQVLKGISEVLSKRRELFEAQYSCVTPDGSRWFTIRVTPLSRQDGGAVVAHEDITKHKEIEEDVRASYRRLQLLSREVQVATERERSRLSRELHDEFGQLLSALKFDLGRMANDVIKKPLASPSVLREKVDGASQVVDRLFVSLRELIRGVRPALLEKLGLVPALEALVNDVRERSGLCCHLAIEGLENGPSIRLEIEGALYRITQELLTNVTRHAEAKQVWLSVHRRGGDVCLTVKDDGRGMSRVQRVGKDRYGLRGIRERVEILGGQVEIQSMVRKGTTVAIIMPVGGRRRISSDGSAQRTVRVKPRKLRHGKKV